MLDAGTIARSVEAIIGHVFANKMLCVEAVQMASPRAGFVRNGTMICGVSNNKRLSILGDAVLTKVLCAAWYGAQDGGGE
jgi:ribonuclease-3